MHPDDVDRIVDEWRDATDSGGAFTSEYRVVDRGGRTKWIRDEAILVRDPVGGGPSFWQGIMTDISDRMEAEVEKIGVLANKVVRP